MLAGHVSRVTFHEEPAGKLLLWSPEAKRRVGRPHITIKSLLEKDTGLAGPELLTAIKTVSSWSKNFVNVSPS